HDVGVTADLGGLLGPSVILASAKVPVHPLAPVRPLNAHGRPIDFLVNRYIDEVLYVGFGIRLKTLHTLPERMDASVLSEVPVPVSPKGPEMAIDRDALQHALAERVNAIATDVLRGQKDMITHRSTAKTRKRSEPEPDALDELLDVAARRRREEIEG